MYQQRPPPPPPKLYLSHSTNLLHLRRSRRNCRPRPQPQYPPLHPTNNPRPPRRLLPLPTIRIPRQLIPQLAPRHILLRGEEKRLPRISIRIRQRPRPQIRYSTNRRFPLWMMTSLLVRNVAPRGIATVEISLHIRDCHHGVLLGGTTAPIRISCRPMHETEAARGGRSPGGELDEELAVGVEGDGVGLPVETIFVVGGGGVER